MTTPDLMELSRRLNRASMRTLAVGMVLSVSVLAAGLVQPAHTYPSEAQVPQTYPITLER